MEDAGNDEEETVDYWLKYHNNDYYFFMPL